MNHCDTTGAAGFFETFSAADERIHARSRRLKRKVALQERRWHNSPIDGYNGSMPVLWTRRRSREYLRLVHCSRHRCFGGDGDDDRSGLGSTSQFFYIERG